MRLSPDEKPHPRALYPLPVIAHAHTGARLAMEGLWWFTLLIEPPYFVRYYAHIFFLVNV